VNLAPRKLRGVESNGMIVAPASAPKASQSSLPSRKTSKSGRAQVAQALLFTLICEVAVLIESFATFIPHSQEWLCYSNGTNRFACPY